MKPTEVAKKDDDAAALAQSTSNAMARPTFVETSREGTEGITSDDIKLPRIVIAQGLSDQMVPTKPNYIKGLALFELFNDQSSEIYGNGPLKFVVVRRDVRRIEFDPEQRGVPLDLDVPANDPRMSWTKDPQTGKGVPPSATKFVEFVIMLLKDDRDPEVVVLSIQETNKHNKKAHERLSGFISLRNPPAPIYAGLYELSSGTASNDKGTFGVPVIRNLGFIQDAKLYDAAKKLHLSLVGKQITVAREPGDETFDTAEMDNGAADPHGM